MRKKYSFRKFLLHSGIDKSEFAIISPMIWQGNMKALRITSLLSLGLGTGFLVFNLVSQSGNWIPYLFLMCGSLISLIIQFVLNHKGIKNVIASMLLCYFQMLLVVAYAGILSAQPSNYDIPATSVIVFIALLPLSIDDRPSRMFTFMTIESVSYLIVSYFYKSKHAFSLDLQNVATFFVVGVILYCVICTRNIRELYQSVRIERIQRNIITSLATVVEERDSNTGDHIKRTQEYVKLLIRKMRKSGKYPDLTKDYCENVILASAMHDIGKIKIPDNILNKPGKLTEKEYEEMKKHSSYGAEIIKLTMSDVEEKDYCQIAYNIAKYHHERWDGNGYPDGLKGEEIPLEARMMALADVYDALISERVYKPAFDKDTSMKIIEEGKGTQFDPDLATLFLEGIKELD